MDNEIIKNIDTYMIDSDIIDELTEMMRNKYEINMKHFRLTNEDLLNEDLSMIRTIIVRETLIEALEVNKDNIRKKQSIEHMLLSLDLIISDEASTQHLYALINRIN